MKRRDRLDPDDYILGPPQDGYKPMMPREGIHLVSGPSGGGKTALMFQMFAAMREGAPFLGYPTKNVPLIYATLDRTIPQTENSLEKAGLPLDAFPYDRYELDMPEEKEKIDFRTQALVMTLLEERPDAKLLVIDGFSMLCSHGKINDYLQAAIWLQSTEDLCAERDISIIGITHSPKPSKDRVMNARQSILGSSAQGGSVATVIYVENISPDSASPKRKVHLCPRDLPPDIRKMKFVHPGILIFDQKESHDDEERIASYIRIMSTKGPVSYDSIEDEMIKEGMSERTIHRHLASLSKGGQIKKPKKGFYATAGADAPQKQAAPDPPPSEGEGAVAPMEATRESDLPWMGEATASPGENP